MRAARDVMFTVGKGCWRWLAGVRRHFLVALLPAALAGAPAFAIAAEPDTLLNVSYDVSREFYKDYNALFGLTWQATTGRTATINQSHGPSTKQAQAVINGLDAGVVTLNQALDVEALVQKDLVRKDWRAAYPHGSVPFYSTTVFVVRKGNPKGIRDWGDLVKGDVKVILPNPKTSGNGRYSYLAAWGWAQTASGGTPARAEAFVTDLFRHVPILDAGGRAATTTFAQRGIGDVLLTFENEVYLIEEEFGRDQFDIIYPSSSLKAELPVAVIEPVVDRLGNRELARRYVQTLFEPAAQDLAARHHLRPSDAAALKRASAAFQPIRLFTVESVFGGWSRVQEDHFKDGGVFDRVVRNAKAPS